jgi:hypothetical protein
MKRLLLAFLLLGMLTLTVPALRQRAQPRIDQSREWLGKRLEGPLSPVLTPYRRLKTQSQMGKAVSALVSRRNMGYPPPKPIEFQEFIQARELSPDGMDAWGAPYLLRQRRDSLDIISAGPDIQYHTDDDLVVSIRYEEPVRERRGARH